VLGLLGLAVGSALGGVLAAVDLVIPVVAGAVVFAGCCVLAAVTLRGDLTADSSRHSDGHPVADTPVEGH